MYAIKVDLHGIEESITRPVLITVTNDIKRLLGMEHDIFTVYDQQDGLTKKKNAVGELRGDNTFKQDKIEVELEETSEDGNDLSLHPIHPDMKPIMIDKEIDASVTPIYHNRKMSIKFKYTSKSKSKIYSICNKLKLFTSSDRMYRRHDLEYSYTVPFIILKLFLHFNNLKNEREIEKLPYENYLETILDDRADLTNSIDGDLNKCALVMHEAQLDALGCIVDDLHNITPEFNDDYGGWFVEFTYEFYYEKPITLICKYPIMVYNQVIDKQYRTFIKGNKPIAKVNRTGRIKQLYNKTKLDDVFQIRNERYYINIPEVDTFRLPPPNNNISRMICVLSQVEDFDNTMLFNIHNIPKVKFKDSVLKFIIHSEREYINQEYYSLFYIELYKNNKKDYKNGLILEEDGTLRTKYPMDYKSTYRVVFNIVNDMTMVMGDGYNRFRQFALEQINSDNNDRTSFTFSYIDNYWTNVDYRKFNSEIRKDNIINDYLTLMQIDGKEIEEAIVGCNQYYDVPFKISSMHKNKPPYTVATALILPTMLEKR